MQTEHVHGHWHENLKCKHARIESESESFIFPTNRDLSVEKLSEFQRSREGKAANLISVVISLRVKTDLSDSD